MHVDLRPLHVKARGRVMRVALMVTLANACVASLIPFMKDAPSWFGVAALWACVLPLVALELAAALLRQVVAREDGLEVDGELIAWGQTTAPEIAFLSRLGGLSRPARAWMEIATSEGRRDLMLLAEPEQIEAIARLRKLDGAQPRPACPAYR